MKNILKNIFLGLLTLTVPALFGTIIFFDCSDGLKSILITFWDNYIDIVLGFVPIILVFGLTDACVKWLFPTEYYHFKNGTVYHKKNCQYVINTESEIVKCNKKFVKKYRACIYCDRQGFWGKLWQDCIIISIIAAFALTLISCVYDKILSPYLITISNDIDSPLAKSVLKRFVSSGIWQVSINETIPLFIRELIIGFVEFGIYALFFDLISWMLDIIGVAKASRDADKEYGDMKLHGIARNNKVNYLLKQDRLFINAKISILWLCAWILIPFVLMFLFSPKTFEHLGKSLNAHNLNFMSYQFYEIATSKGSYDALCEVALCKLEGNGTKQNVEQGVTYLTEAAWNDYYRSPKANFYLGILHLNGDMVVQNTLRSIDELEYAAENGYPEALNVLYEFALDCEDQEIQTRCLEIAARNGHEEAAIILDQGLTNGYETDAAGQNPDQVTSPSLTLETDSVSSGSKDEHNESENLSSAGELTDPIVESTEPTDDVQTNTNANDLRTTLSELQSELEQIKPENIKPTSDVQTINDAESRLNTLSSNLNELKAIVENSDIVQDERDSLTTEIAKQKELVDSKQAELAKVKNANGLYANLSEIQSVLNKIETEQIKPTDDVQTINDAENRLNTVSNNLDQLETSVENSDIVQEGRESLIKEIEVQRKLVESKQAELAKVKNANELHTTLSKLQFELDQIKPENIKPTDDVQTINDAETKLNTVLNSLNELKTTIKEANIVEDERNSLIEGVEEQRILAESKQAELAKVKNANELHASISNLQSKLDEIETESIKPTDDIRIKSADAELKKVSGTLKELRKKIDEAVISILDPGEKITLEENCKELNGKLQSKMNTIELCKHWNRIAEINTRVDKISGWNLKKDDKKELDRLKDELAKIDLSILDISDGERKSLEEKNKKTFQKMISETNDKIVKIYRKHTVIKSLYTGIIIAIVAILWKLIRRRKKNSESGDVNPS